MKIVIGNDGLIKLPTPCLEAIGAGVGDTLRCVAKDGKISLEPMGAPF